MRSALARPEEPPDLQLFTSGLYDDAAIPAAQSSRWWLTGAPRTATSRNDEINTLRGPSLLTRGGYAVRHFANTSLCRATNSSTLSAGRPVISSTGIPPSPITAVTVPHNRIALDGHDLVIVEVGHTDTDGTSVLQVPDLGLVVAGDVIYNGVHMWLGRV